MNYCDKIHYNIYTTGLATFGEMVDALLAQLPQDEQILRLAFFGMPNDNEQYVSRRIMLREKIRKFYGNHEPVLSYVSQPPLNAGLILEVHSYKADEDDHITFRRHGGFPYVVLENADGRFLFAGGLHGDVINFGIQQQSAEVFHMMGEVMRREGFPVNCIIRQWNYIEQITRFDGPDQHYQMFNNARADFYGKTDWSNGYPAATGIGTQWGGIMIDVDALLCKDGSVRVLGVDNPLQIAAHAYSQNVLLGEKDAALPQKTTPKFERAKAVWKEDHGFVYVSGTAAIRGEQSLEGVGIEQQTLTTLENIEYLVSRDNLNRSGIPATENATLITFRVYVKRWEDMEKAKQVVTERYPDLPAIYTLTDVCRSELLIEIEGMGILC